MAPFWLFLASCAPRINIYRYSDRVIVRAPQDMVNEFCGGGTLDSGAPMARDQNIGGCYEKRPTIMVTDSKYLTHEEAHRDGHEDPSKDGYR